MHISRIRKRVLRHFLKYLSDNYYFIFPAKQSGIAELGLCLFQERIIPVPI